MNISNKLRKPARRHQALQINPIAAACALLLFAAGAAQAQQAANVLDTVSVTGIARGIETSIATKRNSDSIVEAISAEDIGKLWSKAMAGLLVLFPLHFFLFSLNFFHLILELVVVNLLVESVVTDKLLSLYIPFYICLSIYIHT